MKLFVFVIASLVLYVQPAPSCKAANYCGGCHLTTADACTSCFTYKSGKVGPRALVSSACTTALTTRLVTDCKIYSGGITSATGTKAATDCTVCDKDFKNWTVTGTVLACSATAVTLTTACTKVANCMQTVCVKDTTESFGCSICNKNYSGATYVNATAGTSSCTKTNAITNCEVMYYTSSIANKACHYCKTKYAVKQDDSACVAYTTDSNCRKLHTGDAQCEVCWDAYYWNLTKCKLSAKVFVATLIMALVNFLF